MLRNRRLASSIERDWSRLDLGLNYSHHSVFLIGWIPMYVKFRAGVINVSDPPIRLVFLAWLQH